MRRQHTSKMCDICAVLNHGRFHVNAHPHLKLCLGCVCRNGPEYFTGKRSSDDVTYGSPVSKMRLKVSHEYPYVVPPGTLIKMLQDRVRDVVAPKTKKKKSV